MPSRLSLVFKTFRREYGPWIQIEAAVNVEGVGVRVDRGSGR